MELFEELPDPFDEFLQQITPLMQSRKFVGDSESPPVYESLEFACLAARHGEELILISGKAALSTKRYEPDTQIETVASVHDIIALQGRMPAARCAIS